VGIELLSPSVKARYLTANQFKRATFATTGQIAQVVRRSLLVREIWGLNPEPIKSPIRCQQLATVATLIVWALAQVAEMGTAHS